MSPYDLPLLGGVCLKINFSTLPCVCCCPFFFVFLCLLILSHVFFSSHDYIHSTPPGFLKLKQWRKNRRRTKKWKDKTKEDFGRMFVVFGGSLLGSTYKLFVSGALFLLFVFLWGGGGGGFPLSMILSSLLQNHNPSKSKQKQKNKVVF